jgi:AraC-like DNA-binding protein
MIHNLFDQTSNAAPLDLLVREAENDGTFFRCLALSGKYFEDLFGTELTPCQMNITCTCICVKGEMRIIVDGRSYHIKKGGMVTLFPESILQICWKSPDYESYAVAITRKFFDSIAMPPTTPTYLYIKENPCIMTTNHEQKDLHILYDELKRRDMRTEHPWRFEISKSLATAIFYEVFAIYQKGTSTPHQLCQRKNTLFLDFQQFVTVHYIEHRGINFYADKLCITPRYLSAVVKEISGLTPSHCIEKVVASNARILLTTTQMTIQHISDELNFPNHSFFSKYFKRVTGMTPKECREKGW